MRTNEFLKETTLSIDALRYYIAIGLLTPEKKNGKFVFSSADVRDAKDLLTLLKWGASLSEIKPILFVGRVAGEPLAENETFRALVPTLISRAKAQARLEQEQARALEALASKNSLTSPQERGFPLEAIPAFFSGANLTTEQVIHNEVFTGSLEVNGRSLPIRHGILCEGILPRAKNEDCQYVGEGNYGKYLQSMPNESVDQVNAFFVALRTLLSSTPTNSLIIDNADGSDALPGALSEYPGQEVLLWGNEDIARQKRNLDGALSRKITYYCSAGNSTPFREGCFDLAVDFFSADLHQAGKGPELLLEMRRLLKNSGRIILCKIIAPGGPLLSEEDFCRSCQNLFALKKVYQSAPFIRSPWDFNFFSYAAEAKISLALYVGERGVGQRSD